MNSVLGQDIFDVIIILLLTFFAIRGYLRGFVSEVATIVSLVGGFWFSHTFHENLAHQLTFIPEPLWRNVLSYVLLFVVFIVFVSLVARGLQKILSFAFVQWADQVAGAILGFAKGVIICSIAFVVLGMFCRDMSFYKNSHVRSYFETFIDTVRHSLPDDVVKRFRI